MKKGHGGVRLSGCSLSALPIFLRLGDKLIIKMLKFSSKHCQKDLQSVAALWKCTPLLSTVVIIGAMLRFWKLGEWSFWKDEVFMVLDAQQLTLDNSPINPIPYLAVKLSIILAGDSEWGSRLMPCIVGILSIPIIFGLGRTLFNWRVGLLAAAFVSFSSWHLFWAQNARCSYIWTFLFAALTAWLFYLSVKRNSMLLTFGALFTCICLILSHLLAVFMVPALAVYAVFCLLDLQSGAPSRSRLENRDYRKMWLNLLIFFGPFAAPMLALVHPKIHGYLFSGWGLNEWSRSPLYIVLTLVQGVSIPIAVTAFFGGIASPSKRPTRFLICYAGVPLLLFLIASQFQNVAGYYLFWTTPAYFILAAVACERLYAKLGRTLFGALVPCILLLNMAAQDYLYFNVENGGRPKWRETFDVIRTYKKPNDKVVLSEPEMGKYYLPELETIYIGSLIENAAGFEKQWISQKHRLWFVVDVGSFNVFDANKKVREWIRQRGRMVRTLPTFSRAKERTIYLYLLE